MSMGRYLCHFCHTVVQYGESCPCLLYPNDDEVYTVPPPNEHDEMEGRGEESMERNNDNLYENNGSACSSAVGNDSEERKEANSLLNVNSGRMSMMPLFRRKRGRSTPLSSEFDRGKKNRFSDSKSPSTHTKETEGSKNVAIKSEIPREMRGAPTNVLPMRGPSLSAGSTTGNPVSGYDAAAASVAGPSGTRGQTRETGEEKPFECDVCGKAFARKSDCEIHCRKHTGDKPYACPDCDQTFTHKGNLTAHIRTHTGERPFKCDICGKAFARKGNLNSHLRTHTGEQPFKCDFCGKGYAVKSNLTSHIRIHTGEKPYRCPFCGRQFTFRSACNKHQKDKCCRK